MSTTFIDKDKIQQLQQKLETNKDMSNESQIGIIENTSKELFDLFKEPENVADYSMKEDIKKIGKILEERKDVLESRETIPEKKMNGRYGELFSPIGSNIKTKDMDAIRAETRIYYEDITDWFDPTNFPTFGNFRSKIRKDAKYKIDDIETMKKTNPVAIKNVHDALKTQNIFKSGLSAEMMKKLTRLIILFAQVDYLLENGGKANGLAAVQEIIKKINQVKQQIEAYKTTTTALNIIKKREKALDMIETTDPKNIAKTTPNKTTKTPIKIDLKKHFLDPTRKLNELPEGYEIHKLELKDKKNTSIEIFEDNAGKKFEKKLKQGESADIFIKNTTGTYKKIGTIGIAASTPGELEIELDAYKDLPEGLEFPTKIEMETTGIGGNGKTISDKVGITKTIDIEREKPDFEPEYDSLDTIIKYQDKLEKMYNDLYEMVLEDQLNKFFTNHENESIRNGRKSLSDDEKKTFFIDVIKNNTTPIRGGGIANIDKLRKDNILTLKQFQDAFKKGILEGFTGKDDIQLKEHILEKLGTEPRTKENPTYAQGILGEKVMDVYQKDDEKKALWMAINKFLLGIGDKTITKADDKDLYPGTPDLRGEKEITASVADVEAVSEEQARNEANEEFTKKYQDSVKRSLTRAKLFFFRTRIINNKIKKLMKNTSGKLLTDEETTSAVNRRMMKKELNMAGANKIKVENRIFNDPGFQQDVNRIVNEYLQDNGRWTKEAFQNEINRMIEDNHQLSVYMEKNKISQIGSNLIERVEFEKEQRAYYKQIFDITERYTSGQIKTRTDYDNQIRQKLGEFSDKQKRLPDLVKELKLDINATDFAEKLAAHKNVLEKMRNRTVNMRINMLVNAKPNIEPKGIKKLFTGVQKDERGLTTAQHVQIDKLGGRSKFYRWIEKHPRRTAIGTSAGLIGAAMIPVVGVGVGAGMLFTLNYLKKRGHYTKEHVKFEKELLSMTPEQRDQYLKDMKEDAEKRPERLRKIFPKKYDKYGESMEYLNKTQSTQQYINNIKRYTSTGTILSTAEIDSLREYILKGIAILKLQEDKGRNFMYSQKGQEGIEKLYNDLYTTVLGGIGRLDSSVDPVATYTKIKSGIGKHTKNTLRTTDYEENRKKMTKMRTKLGLFAGSKAAAIYLGTARLMGQVRESWDHVFSGTEHANTEHITSINIDNTIKTQIQTDLGRTIDFNNINPNDQQALITWFKDNGYSLNNATNEIFRITTIPGGGLQLDSAFGTNGNDLLTKVFDGDTAKFELFKSKISALQTGDRSSTLRGTMKDIYGTNALATEKTRAFFDNFGSSIMENSKHELIALTSQSPLSNAGAEKIAQKMTERYSNSGMLSENEFRLVTDPVKIKNLFDAFANGSADLNNLPTGRDIQTANDVLHCKYGGFGDGLKEYIFDIGKATSKDEIIGKIGTEIPGGGEIGGWNRARFNSFGVPTFRNEVNNFKEKNQQ